MWHTQASSECAVIVAEQMNEGNTNPDSVTIHESDDWVPIEYSQDITPGSALDFSFLNDAPAGKHGPVLCEGGDFVFRNMPGKPVRFYGVNISFWSGKLWKRETFDKLADRIAMAGFNAVRIHAYDTCFLVENEPSYKIDKSALSKFDYLIEALKKRGIYITIDLLVKRNFRKGEIDEIKRGPGIFGGEDFKSLIPISDSAFMSWSLFTSELLLHTNTYSGIPMKDDPALFSISLVNENTIFSLLRSINKTPDIKTLYDEKFAQWILEKGLTFSDENGGGKCAQSVLAGNIRTELSEDENICTGIRRPTAAYGTKQWNGNSIDSE